MQSRYAGYDGAEEITLIEGWDRMVPWLITWESGPYEWAYRATMGGINEEVSIILSTEFGVEASQAAKSATERVIEFPEGVLAEPYHSFSLALSED